MLVLLFYSIICETIYFKDKNKLTINDVYAKMHNNEIITADVIIENINIIGANAFFGCEILKSISISSSVESIEINAFYECSKLEKISFGEESNLTTIGEYAFFDCEVLKSISFPSSVE